MRINGQILIGITNVVSTPADLKFSPIYEH